MNIIQLLISGGSSQYMGIMEKKMETTIVYWANMGLYLDHGKENFIQNPGTSNVSWFFIRLELTREEEQHLQ